MRNTVAGAADERDEHTEAGHALGDRERGQDDAGAQSTAPPPEACERHVRAGHARRVAAHSKQE